MKLGDNMIEAKELYKTKKCNKTLLRQEFAIAMQDETFRKVIKEVNVDDRVLEKYTSSLIDATKERKVCDACKGLACCKNQVPGFCYTPLKDENKISFSYVACRYKTKYLSETSYLNNIYLFDIPREIKEARIKDIYTDDKNRVEVIKYIKKYHDNFFDSREKGLYLYGSFGSGKTYLVAALFNELAKKNVKSAIIYFPEFLRSLKESFSNGYADKFDYIKKVPLLLLDDIGAENVTTWSRDEVLGSILQYRMQEKLPTFFTSNLSLAELEEHLSTINNSVDKVKARRIIERIEYLTQEMRLVATNRRY